MTEQKFVYVDVDYLKELEETAKKVDYYKGIIDGIMMCKDEPQKKEVEWVYNKRERLWYPYSNGELLFKTENSSEKPNNCEEGE